MLSRKLNLPCQTRNRPDKCGINCSLDGDSRNSVQSMKKMRKGRQILFCRPFYNYRFRLNQAGPMALLKTEFAVRIFPVRVGRNRFHRVPMFGDLALMDTEQVVERGRLAREFPLLMTSTKLPWPKTLCTRVYFIVIPWSAIAFSAAPSPDNPSAIAGLCCR